MLSSFKLEPVRKAGREQVVFLDKVVTKNVALLKVKAKFYLWWTVEGLGDSLLLRVLFRIHKKSQKPKFREIIDFTDLSAEVMLKDFWTPLKRVLDFITLPHKRNKLFLWAMETRQWRTNRDEWGLIDNFWLAAAIEVLQWKTLCPWTSLIWSLKPSYAKKRSILFWANGNVCGSWSNNMIRIALLKGGLWAKTIIKRKKLI